MSGNRFALLTPDLLKKLTDNAENKNTIRSTKNWINIYREWAAERGCPLNMEEVDFATLDTILAKFYAEVRKQDGNDYEPDCLRVMQGAIHRYLVEKKSGYNIIRDAEFAISRNVLEGKARQLRANGMGKRPNASKALSKSEEDILWNLGKLGDSNPTSLVRTVWYMNIQHFGLRGCQEHCTMQMENFERKIDENGEKFIEFSEDTTKTRQHGLHPNPRVTKAKMFPTGGIRCPVRLWELYVSKRPTELQTTGRFYLTPKLLITESVWYSRNPMGKNTIAGIMKSLISGTEIKNSGKKITNHSGRKTAIKKMKLAKVPESSIIKVTGHKSTAGLKSYDPEDEGEFRDMSNAIATTSNHSRAFPVSSWSNDAVAINTVPLSSSGEKFVFNSCNVTLNMQNTQVMKKSHKRKYVIYDSSSDSQSQ